MTSLCILLAQLPAKKYKLSSCAPLHPANRGGQKGGLRPITYIVEAHGGVGGRCGSGDPCAARCHGCVCRCPPSGRAGHVQKAEVVIVGTEDPSPGGSACDRTAVLIPVSHLSCLSVVIQIEFLVRTFMAGHGAENKRHRKTAEQAELDMAKQRDPDTNRRMFSRRSPHGAVLLVPQIRSWFSSFKAKITKGTAIVDPEQAGVHAMSVAALREELGVRELSSAQLP